MELLKINPKQFGIVPNTGSDLCLNFQALFTAVERAARPTYIALESGVYDIWFNDAVKDLAYITNTIGEDEVKTPIHTFALLLRGLNDLEIDGNNATIMLHGNMTNLCIDHCRNIKIRSLAIDHARPTISQVEVVKRNAFSTELAIHPDSKYRIEGGKLVFYGDNWTRPADTSTKAWWTILRPADEKDRLVRTRKHPFFGSFRVKELSENRVLVRYLTPTAVKVGEVYSLSDCTRVEVGVFINRSENVVFENFKQFYNHSHGVVAQCCKDLSFDYIAFAPKKGSGRVVASQTDFLHFNMCRGDISVTNGYFEGANDDCINVHGVFFKVLSVNGDEVRVKFCEHQCYGFNPIDPGDKVNFVDAFDLLKIGEATVVTSEMEDLYVIKLVLDNRLPTSVKADCLLENAAAQPNLKFSNNFVSMVTTRGVLATTAGKIDIVENTFKKTSMSGVFVSSDGKAWYESGAVTDLNIEGNKFIDCYINGVLIWPENRLHHGAVHSNVNIENNSFILKGARAITIKSTKDVTVKDNVFSGSTGKQPLIKLTTTENVSIKDNEMDENYRIEKD